MRLSEFSVRNYRSITRQAKVFLGDHTTLVGPNNEGKSNLLRAMALGMELIEGWGRVPRTFSTRQPENGMPISLLRSRGRWRGSRFEGGRDRSWDWERDYPLMKQGATGAQPTLMRLRFSLDDTEIAEFQTATGVRCNGDLPVEIRLTKDRASLGIVKQGRGAASYQAKAREIAEFIGRRIEFVHVQAVRTSDQARLLVDDLVQERIAELSRSEEYQELIARLAQLQNEAILPLQASLTDSVQKYIPSLVGIEIERADLTRSLGVGDLLVDDGARTSMDSKGDGIKSLLTMALIHELNALRHSNHTLILAVDEPEAHLHPRAIHELDAVFRDLSSRQQVILATHNPVFVNRSSPRSNILVQQNAAKIATSIKQIRNAIGVQVQDNLESAEFVVFVEGHTDASVLPALLRSVDQTWSRPRTQERVVFKSTTGTGKMASHIQREKSTVCRIFVVLDDDAAGRQEASNIIGRRLIPQADVFLLAHSGKKESELEDLLNPDVYLNSLMDEFGRPFKETQFRNPSKKWSVNFHIAAQSLGVAGDPSENLERAKVAVAGAVQQSDPTARLLPASVESVQTLNYLLTDALMSEERR